MLVAAILTSIGAGLTMPVMNIIFGKNISHLHLLWTYTYCRQVVWLGRSRGIIAKMPPRRTSSSKRQLPHARKYLHPNRSDVHLLTVPADSI